MQIKFWLASIYKSFRIRPSRAKRRWLTRRLQGRSPRFATIGLAVAASTYLFTGTSLAQCDGPIFSSQIFPVGSLPASVAIADLNGDGFDDLAFANLLDGTASVVLGNGDGTFSVEQTFEFNGSFILSIVSADFDGDGIGDLVASAANDDLVSVLLGNGDGTFAAQQTFPVDDNPRDVDTGDFNGDGLIDLVTANSISNNVSVLLGNGDGTFAEQQSFPVGLSPRSVTIADFNGDGLTDLATGNSVTNNVSVLLGNGDGTFAAHQTFLVGSSNREISTGDINNDGIADLVTANAFSDDISVLLGNGDGTFAPEQRIATGDFPVSVAIGDFNGDGLTDLAVSQYYINTVSVLLGDEDGTFENLETVDVGSRPRTLLASDLNNDGLLDLALPNILGNNYTVLLNQCDTAPEIVVPESLDVFRGVQIAGTLGDVFESDDARTLYNPGFVLSSDEAPVWLIFDAALSSDSPDSLSITVESQAGTPGITRTLEAFNWVSSAYEEIDVSPASFNTDTVVTVDVSSGVSNYVQTGSGDVRARIGWRMTGFTLVFPWEVRLDQFAWTAE